MSNYTDQELTSIIYSATKEFYELVYKDEWFKEIFAVVKQELITNQQTDFMVQAMGGPKKYCGRSPNDAHPHIYIDEDMWMRREEILMQAFTNMKTPEDIKEKWLKIDNAFRRSILKTHVSECKKRYTMDNIIDVPNPRPTKKAA